MGSLGGGTVLTPPVMVTVTSTRRLRGSLTLSFVATLGAASPAEVAVIVSICDTGTPCFFSTSRTASITLSALRWPRPLL